MLISFATDTIKVIRAPKIDDGRGGERYDFRSPQVTRTPIEGCSVQPGPSNEVRESRDAELIAWTVLAPEDADVTGSDQVEYEGKDYRIYGVPQRWTGPSELTSHTLIYLRRWEG
jgi:hypothetical protein